MIGHKLGTGGSSGARLSGSARSTTDSSRSCGTCARCSGRSGLRMSESMTQRDARARARRVSDSRELDVSRQPLDGCGAACARKAALETYWERVGGRRARSLGAVAAGDRRRSPTASARSSVRRAGSVFLGPNVSVLQAALATCIDFSRRPQRSRLRGAAVSVADVRLARVGALRRAHVRVVPSDDGRTIPTERIVAAITETDGDRRALARLLRFRRDRRRSRRFKRTAATSARCSASTRIRRPASIRTT